MVLATVVNDRNTGLAFGAMEHLTKPVDPRELVRVLGAINGGSPKEVLVIDDDPATRNLCRRLLTRDGWTVREAATGGRGLELLDQRRPAVLLLDLMLPDMDGADVLVAIGDRPALADLPIIVVTSKDLTVDEIGWLEARTAALVRKGTTGRADLVSALKRSVPLTEAEA